MQGLVRTGVNGLRRVRPYVIEDCLLPFPPLLVAQHELHLQAADHSNTLRFARSFASQEV